MSQPSLCCGLEDDQDISRAMDSALARQARRTLLLRNAARAGIGPGESERVHERLGRTVIKIAAMIILAISAIPASGQRARTGGLNQDQIDELSHKHDGYYGALAPQNLAAPRPKAPFDVTGTWFIDLRRAFSDFMFGPPYPEFNEAGQTALRESAEARAAGKSYRDSIGQCYPAGMPMIMTRVWPIAMIQLPTAIYQVYGFTNSLRIIYLDGRTHTDPDLAIPTYNGESIGHWEGGDLVVHSKYFETNEHWVDSGIPISDEFEIVERYRLVENGTMLEIDFTLTDPKNWKGEWKSTKRWLRVDYSDIPEVECLPNLNDDIPGTAKGQAETERRGRDEK